MHKFCSELAVFVFKRVLIFSRVLSIITSSPRCLLALSSKAGVLRVSVCELQVFAGNGNSLTRPSCTVFGTETEDTEVGRELSVVRVECDILLFDVCFWTNSPCSLTDRVNSVITFSSTADFRVA